MPDLSEWLVGQLAALERENLRRRPRVCNSAQNATIRVDGREVVNFSSNDYLGLADSEPLREAALAAIDAWGVGAGASRLISGTSQPHRMLEDRIAAFKGTERALVFSTGFAAALGTIPALVGPEDVVILDKLSHACLVDAARASGANLRVFPHNDVDRLESHLKWARGKFSNAKILVITESVFSMDGDVAPLAEIVRVKNAYDAWLFLDEAHAVGVIGNHGRGLADALGLAADVEVQMGTLGKALGTSGGYIAGSAALCEWLINRARSFVFSTAPSPVVASAGVAAIDLLMRPEGAERRDRLWANIRALQPDAESAIIPAMVGDAGEAVMIADDLFSAGFWVPAVRFPTVPRNTARLRISLTANHTADQIAALTTRLSTSLEVFGR